MAGEWLETRMGDLVDRGALSISDGYRVRNEELGSEGIPFVRGGDIRDGWINTSTEDHIRPELADRVRDKLTRPGDAAFITKGTVGRAGWLRPEQPQVVFAPQVAYWRVTDPSVLDPRFIFYLMRSYEFQSALDGVKTHGAMAADYVSISQQHDFQFRLPGVEAQRAIAHILGTLDDKIELNRRMNETLEEMARALFKSWFVDFDPVRAKMEGRDPGLPRPLADLFPARLVDSELGEIPEGWNADTIASLSKANPEVWIKEARPAELRYVDLSNTKWGRIEVVTPYAAADAPSRAQRVLRPRDTIIGTVRPGNGSYALILESGLTGSTGFVVLRPNTVEWAEFVYLACTNPDNIDVLAHLADGAAYPAIRPDVIAATPIVRPDGAVLTRFSTVAGALLTRIAHAEKEGRTLATIRDGLLPKLISGELRVKDAENFLGRATS